MRMRSRFFFTPTSALVRRVVIYGIMLFLLVMVQTSLPFIPLFEGALPNLVLAAVAAVGFFDSERSGAVSGIAAGLCLDALGSAALCLMPIAGFVAGYFSGLAAGKILPRNPMPFTVCLAGVSVMNMVLTVIYAYASVPEVRPWLLFVHTLLPEAFFTFILGIPVMFLARFCVKLAGKTGRKRVIS
jgi:cell shape-determining protein MreD